MMEAMFLIKDCMDAGSTLCIVGLMEDVSPFGLLFVVFGQRIIVSLVFSPGVDGIYLDSSDSWKTKFLVPKMGKDGA